MEQFLGTVVSVINLYSAYFKPGTVSAGFGTLISKLVWGEGNSRFEAVLEFEPGLEGRTVSVLACVAPGHEYRVTLDGKEVPTVSPEDGQLEISLKACRKAAKLIINTKD